MAAKVVLHALATIDKEVVVCVVVARAIVIVYSLLRRVVVNEEAGNAGAK